MKPRTATSGAQPALVAMVESEAVRQGARRPEVVARLVDLDHLAADDAAELRLAVAEQVTSALTDAPELKRVEGPVGAISPEPRVRGSRQPREADLNTRLRRSLRR